MLCRPNFNHPICHLRIVDRMVDIIRRRSRFSLALQFEVYRQRLRSPTFFRSHAAAPLKLQPFYDDLPRHKSILKDWISGCQPIVSGVCEEGNPLALAPSSATLLDATSRNHSGISAAVVT